MKTGSRIGVAGTLLLLAALVSGVDAQNKGKDKDKDKDVKKDIKDAKPEVKPIPIVLRTECERPEAIYKVDETVVFLLASTASGAIDYVLTEDGMKTVGDGKLRVVAGQTYKLEGKLSRPGFLRLQLTQGSATAQAAAGIEPTKIEATAKPPEDFDDFWKIGRAHV